MGGDAALLLILERMVDKRPEADRLLVAEIWGEARHRARWRELSSDEEAAAVAALRDLAGGRIDLLAEVAGSWRAPRRVSRASRWPGPPRACAAWPGLTRTQYRRGWPKGGGGGLSPRSRRSPAACTAH
jgi:hypothetical protein